MIRRNINLFPSKPLRCVILCVATLATMCEAEIIPMIKPEYLLSENEGPSLVRESATTVVPVVPAVADDEHDDQGASYVFLQKFPLLGTPFYHTEVVVCPKNAFDAADRTTLDGRVAAIANARLSPHRASRLGDGESSSSSSTGFVEIAESWWGARDVPCVELGYGGAACREKCCSVPHGEDQVPYPLNARRSVISNADVDRKSLYLYGVGAFSGEVAYRTLCAATAEKCWSNWSGADYRVLRNNCNTFTSTVLSCVYGLSENKPHLGVSDMVTVKCRCPRPKSSLDTAEETKTL